MMRLPRIFSCARLTNRHRCISLTMSYYERLEAASFLDDPSQPLQSAVQAPTLPFDVASAGFNPLIEPYSEVRTSPVLTSAPWLFETWLQSAGDHAMPQGVHAVASIDDSGFAASGLTVGPSSAMADLASQTPRRGAPKRTKASSASPSKREKTFACREYVPESNQPEPQLTSSVSDAAARRS